MSVSLSEDETTLLLVYSAPAVVELWHIQPRTSRSSRIALPDFTAVKFSTLSGGVYFDDGVTGSPCRFIVCGLDRQASDLVIE